MSILIVPFTEAARRRRWGNQGGSFPTVLSTALGEYTIRPSARLADDRFVYLPYYVILCLRNSDASAADVGIQWSLVMVLERHNGPRRLRDHDDICLK